jgi:hypothetical protein
MIVALVALFVALGGSAYAALNLPANSVGTRQIQNAAVTRAKLAKGAVTSGKVKDHSLLAKDFSLGQLPSGPQGPRGPAGATGPVGPSNVFTGYAPDIGWGEGLRGVLTLAAVNLAPGKYVAFGRAYVENGLNMAQEVACGLGTPGVEPVSDDTSHATDTSRIQLASGDEQSLTLLGPVNLPSGGEVSLDCYPTGSPPLHTGVISFRGNQVSAIQVGSLSP